MLYGGGYYFFVFDIHILLNNWSHLVFSGYYWDSFKLFIYFVQMRRYLLTLDEIDILCYSLFKFLNE